MTDSQQPQITSSLLPMGEFSRSGRLLKRNPAWLLQQLQTKHFGTLQLVGMPFLVKYRWYINSTCTQCPRKKALYVDNMLQGLTKTCRCMSNRTKTLARGLLYTDPRAKILSRRYTAILQRTQNPKCEAYPEYGGRGVQAKFASHVEFVEYCLKELPHPTYRDVQIDRIDNNGHYAPGNIRIVPQSVNLRNTRKNKYYMYTGHRVVLSDLWHLIKTDHPEFALTPRRTAALAALNVPIESILMRKPHKRWSKKGSMTSSTPDLEIVSLYRGS